MVPGSQSGELAVHSSSETPNMAKRVNYLTLLAMFGVSPQFSYIVFPRRLVPLVSKNKCEIVPPWLGFELRTCTTQIRSANYRCHAPLFFAFAIFIFFLGFIFLFVIFFLWSLDLWPSVKLSLYLLQYNPFVSEWHFRDLYNRILPYEHSNTKPIKWCNAIQQTGLPFPKFFQSLTTQIETFRIFFSFAFFKGIIGGNNSHALE